jgi:hypothetical protein
MISRLATVDNAIKKPKQTNRKEDKTYRKRLQRKKDRPSGLTRKSQLIRQNHSGYSKC